MDHGVGRAVLASAPNPAEAARMTSAQLRAALKRAVRTRGIDAEPDSLRTVSAATTRALHRLSGTSWDSN